MTVSNSAMPQKRYRCRLTTLAEVRHEMSRVYRETRSGLIASGDGYKLTVMLQSIGKVIEGSDLEQRISQLESRNG